MITKLDIRSVQGGFLSLPLADASNGFVVQDIDGLGPVKATLVSSSFAQQDGAQYQSSRRESRNVKLKLGLEPDWTVDTVQGLRRKLYSVMMPKMPVELTFLTSDGLEVKISGYVESNEPVIFSEEPAVDISIMCFEPDFIDPDPILVNGLSTAGTTPITVNYVGTTETGILFKFLVNRTMNGFTIYHQASDGNIRSLDFQAAMIAGDVITISTVSGDKYATRTRAGVTNSILFGVSPQAKWIELTQGLNTLRVYATGAEVPYTVQYLNRYGAL